MPSFEEWLETMFLFCSSEVYDLKRLKSYATRGGENQANFRIKFRAVLTERPFTAEYWCKEMNFDHESDDDLYEFLSALYNFLYADGPYPDWD